MERNIALEARLIDDLLDITMIVRGKLRLRIQPCDAHSLIGLAVEIVRDDARLKEITIARAFEATQSGLIVDPARFQQVIWNLLRNAVKFTPRGGRIEIRTHNRTDPDSGPSLCIEVSDSGIGISAAELERIFLPFEQGRVSGDHRFGGIGLGLSIARAIVSLHGGRISAQSGGTDAGATFVIELPSASQSPLGVAAAEPPAGPSPKGETPALRSPDARESLSLLLVEDHQATLEGLSRLLTREGHRVVTASSVADALAAGAAQKFDFVVSDLGLPDGTGIELMEQLRARHGLRGIALSGYGMEEDLARSREAGFVAHLVKPVDFAQLRRALKLLG
jgi:CheY-like chemotaxis protein/anti-sigma regulatory factor (Ser/Thr protein kinase)